MKAKYVKPTMEIVEVRLSDCIAGSNDVQVDNGIVTHSEVKENWIMTSSTIVK